MSVSGVQPPKDTSPDQKSGQEGNEGLKRRCSMCGAKPGSPCTYLHSDEPRPEMHEWRQP